MSDRFKFRAWDAELKEMVTENDVDMSVYQGELKACYIAGSTHPTFSQGEMINCVLMQCTGLRDKNGVLIYEGDIVSLDDIKIEVTWFDGGFHILTNKDQTRSSLIQQRARYFEVIGNKFQNEDLLNE